MGVFDTKLYALGELEGKRRGRTPLVARPKITDNPKAISVILDRGSIELLDLVARASPIGRPSRAEMIRVAVDEFVRSRMSEPAVREFVESHLLIQPLRLHRPAQG